MIEPAIQLLEERVAQLQEQAERDQSHGARMQEEVNKLILQAQYRRADAWAISQVINQLKADNGQKRPYIGQAAE